MTHSSAFKTWTKRLEHYRAGEPIPKSMINAIKSTLTERWAGSRCIRSRSTLTETEREALTQAFAPGESRVPEPLGWAITEEQAAQGLAWLNKLPKRFRLFDPAAFDRFTFDGLYLDDSRPVWRAWHPVYRIHLKDGSSIAYTARPWQARSADKSLPPYEVIP